jgi:hypothetical protein
MWAARVAKHGFRWKVGKGDKVSFWSDVWIGNCSLAILFWDLFVIANEQHITVAQAWDGKVLRLTFLRSFSSAQYNRWLELTQLLSIGGPSWRLKGAMAPPNSTKIYTILLSIYKF